MSAFYLFNIALGVLEQKAAAGDQGESKDKADARVSLFAGDMVVIHKRP